MSMTMVEEAVQMTMTMIEDAVETTIEAGTATTTMKAIVTQVRDYDMEKHAMKDAEILNAQKIEGKVGTPTTLTSTTASMKRTTITTQVKTQNTLAHMCHGHKT